jgi:transposase-like protein
MRPQQLAKCEIEGFMKTRVNGRRKFSREFKVAAVRRVLEGEQLCRVARDLELGLDLLWRWRKRVVERGEEHLYSVGRRTGQPQPPTGESKERRIMELERLVGRQQMEIRFLDKALRRVKELRQEKNDDGEAASSKR